MSVLLKKWWWLNNLFLLLFHCGFIRAQTLQNLVPNGSFEAYTQCPNNSSQIYYAPPWSGPTTNSSDYFNACSTTMNVPHYGGIGSSYPYYLNAKDGNAYVGMYTYQLNNYREYIQNKLLDTLHIGLCYYVEFFVTNIQNVKYCTNNIRTSFLKKLNV